MGLDLTGKTVLLVGAGRQIADKAEKLMTFGPELVCLDRLSEEALEVRPAFVVIGDLEQEEAEEYSSLCKTRGVPVNVVDRPELCTFFFPSLIQRGDLVISVSTGGKSPAAAACLRRQIETSIPDRTEDILDWLWQLRPAVRETISPEKRGAVLRETAARAFFHGRPLTQEEWEAVLDEVK